MNIHCSDGKFRQGLFPGKENHFRMLNKEPKHVCRKISQRQTTRRYRFLTAMLSNLQIYWGQTNGNNPVNNGGLSRKHIIEGVNASLERLGLEYVGLICAHRSDRYTPMEELSVPLTTL